MVYQVVSIWGKELVDYMHTHSEKNVAQVKFIIREKKNVI